MARQPPCDSGARIGKNGACGVQSLHRIQQRPRTVSVKGSVDLASFDGRRLARSGPSASRAAARAAADQDRCKDAALSPSARRLTGSVSHVIAALGLAAACSAWTPVHASCKTPLPTNVLRALDASADTDPIAAVAEANRQLALQPPADDLTQAELYAIIADAQDTIDDDPAARDAVAKARQRLDRLATNQDIEHLRVRLALVEADGLQTADALAAGAMTLTQLEKGLVRDSIEHACLLLSRSRIEGRLTHQDEAAAAAVAAYRIARNRGSDDIAADAAYELATTYRRAGLFTDALRMAEEAIAYTRSANHLAALANALWEKARTLGDAGQYAAALETLDESAKLTARLGDVTGIGFDDQERCNELLGLQRIDAAERACQSADRRFSALGRQDQRIVTQYYQVRIDILRGRLKTALARLNPALDGAPGQIPPRILAGLYAERAEVLSRLGRASDAFQDLTRSVRIDAHENQLQRSLGAAALNAQLQIERIDQDKRELERKIVLERELSARRATSARLSLGIAAAALALSASLAALLWTRSRHQRAMRLAATSLETHARVIRTVREGVLLLDDEGRIDYANPALLRLVGREGEEVRGMGVEALGLAAKDLTESLGVPTDNPSDGGRELHLTTRAGDELVLLQSQATLELDRGSVRIYVLQDVTERRRLEREVLEIVSAERDRLSNDIHDGLGQELTGVALLLKSVLSKGEPDRTTLELVLAHVNGAIRSTRTLAHTLAPVHIAGGALDVALTRLAAELSETWPMLVTCDAAIGKLRLGATESDHLYRIAQEAITNAMRHSGCKVVAIKLNVVVDDLLLEITDDGVGFERDANSAGVGLRTIAYRARLLKGTMRIERPANGGARVVISVPVKNLLD
jgi:two-component system sensor histidine kinase UhpB